MLRAEGNFFVGDSDPNQLSAPFIRRGFKPLFLTVTSTEQKSEFHKSQLSLLRSAFLDKAIIEIKLAQVTGKQSRHRKAFWQNVSDSLITYCILEYPFFVESQMIPIDMQRLIKKTSNPVRKKIAVTPPPSEPIEMPKSQDIPELVVEPNPPVYIEDYVSESEYISEHYRPLRSVGNSGWQPSDVWRELRVDDFCG